MRLAHSVTVTAAWLPYFDDGEFESVSPDARWHNRLTCRAFFGKVNMLLFIAPVSAFNQTLTEDRSVNRLVRFCASGLWASTIHDLTWLWDPIHSGIRSFCGSRCAYTSYWKRRHLCCCSISTTCWTQSSGLESSFDNLWHLTKTDQTKRRTSCSVSPTFYLTSSVQETELSHPLYRFKGEIFCDLPAGPREHSAPACACHLRYGFQFNIHCAC